MSAAEELAKLFASDLDDQLEDYAFINHGEGKCFVEGTVDLNRLAEIAFDYVQQLKGE